MMAEQIAPPQPTLPPMPKEPVLPLGTQVRAHPSGWGAPDLDDDEGYELAWTDGVDDAPTLEGYPEWIVGPLDGKLIPGAAGYFRHTINGVGVDPFSVEETDEAEDSGTALTAGGDASYSGCIVALIPAAGDPITAASSEPAHITLVWLGDEDDLAVSPDQIIDEVAAYAKQLAPIIVPTTGRAILDGDANVVMLEPIESLVALREDLLNGSPAIGEAYADAEQYPDWNPHVTLGYPDTPALDPGYAGGAVMFDRIGAWLGDGQYDFPLSGASLVAAGGFNPGQVRVPKGNDSGGEWMPTAGALGEMLWVNPVGRSKESPIDEMIRKGKGLPPPPPEPPGSQEIAAGYQAMLQDAVGIPSVEVAVNGVSGGDEYDVKLMGILSGPGGVPLGTFERTIKDGIVTHDQFKLDPVLQGQGIGSRMMKGSEEIYRQLGYSQIKVHANIDVGGYTWARQGFEFADEDQAARTIGWVLGSLPADSPLFGDLKGMFDGMREGIMPLPADLAALGWTEGATTWPGKEGLLGSEWFGVKNLNPGLTAAAVADPRAWQIGLLHEAWVPTARYDSIPVPGDSQYPETEEDVHTHADSDAEFMPMMIGILNGALLAAGSFNPAQVRVPKGNDAGGQWVETAGGLLKSLDDGSEVPKISSILAMDSEADQLAAMHEVFDAGRVYGNGFEVFPKEIGYDDAGNLAVNFSVEQDLTGEGDYRQVGSMNRIFAEGAVENDYLELGPEAKGQGFSSAFGSYAEDYYRANGVTDVFLHAGLEDGGYVWAKAGFEWDTSFYANNNDELQSDISQMALQVGAALDKYGSDEYVGPLLATVLGYLDYASDDPEVLPSINLQELANLTFNGKPIGREVLGGTSWRGKKQL